MVLHDLKCWPDSFNALVHEEKTFEWRKNDRGFEVGDTLWLREWEPTSGKYTGREIKRSVAYILSGSLFGIPEGYCIMSLRKAVELAAEEKTPRNPERFKRGDLVTWASQACGKTITKEGMVIDVVPAGEYPPDKVHGSGKGKCLPRDHESYVILGSAAGKRNKRFWPLVKNLRRLYERFNELALRDEIVRVWGPAGAHIDVYDMLLKKAGERDILDGPLGTGTT
jgi:hypothetical protein